MYHPIYAPLCLEKPLWRSSIFPQTSLVSHIGNNPPANLSFFFFFFCKSGQNFRSPSNHPFPGYQILSPPSVVADQRAPNLFSKSPPLPSQRLFLFDAFKFFPPSKLRDSPFRTHFFQTFSSSPSTTGFRPLQCQKFRLAASSQNSPLP